jgi:two-component system phosphate regulon sensor histidine kinase PhoR
LKIQLLFYCIVIYVLAAFAWWTYSLIELSKALAREEHLKLEQEIDKANRYLYRNYFHGYFTEADKEKIPSPRFMDFDTTVIRREVESQFPNVAITFLNKGKAENITELASIAPRASAVETIERTLQRKTWMYIGEAVVFLLILFWGFVYIYRSFRARIMLNQQQSNFMLSVTHELKSPLASIKLFLQTLQKRELDRDTALQLIDHSVKDVDRLNELVENLLLASRIESNNYRYMRELFNMSQMVGEICSRMEKVFHDKILFTFDIEDDLYFRGDQFTLSLAVANLVENAVKYSPPGSGVEVKLGRKKDCIVLCVSDEGFGIMPEEKRRIFRKFYRVGNEETRKTKGTGLGLYIVKQVFDRHSARINVKDNDPKGTIFEITFKDDKTQNSAR